MKWLLKINTMFLIKNFVLLPLLALILLLHVSIVLFFQEASQTTMQIIAFASSALAIFLVSIGYMSISRYVSDITKAVEISKKIASGSLYHRITQINKNNDTGALFWALNDILDQFESFSRDLEASLHAVENGKMHRKLLSKGLRGDFVKLSASINNSLKSISVAQSKEESFNKMSLTINKYIAGDYTTTVDVAGVQKDLLTLVESINKLGGILSQSSYTTFVNGLELQNEAGTLKQSVELLLTSSNQQAASLEETAAAMEEMTSNVQNNVAKSNDMALMATQTDSAAKDGAVLASRTASAMTEIQSATNSINDAVAIIENIAFQTNILSLNAAVEAATAGDAGKGFAVVAQEVRNLANRSADAAKEIKAMASQAAHKSNEGMNIATELTRGFEVIADKIAQTASMVQDVSNANREQMQGIGQINTAVTQLDQMTQENAKVAAQADAIANATISKAEAMVQDAQSKEFVGKNNIRATATRTNAKPVQAAKPVVVKQKYASNAIAKNSSKHESDVWENF
ncbi:methyl-accepting chemotaxis protein [Sulfurimonas sp.]|uniref:methyl-accepting chemotaxis protein n=2 Tax=Sulfurimonas sp. TaxID=2022749 RepID=UPI002603B1D8|nr:methyl-accepting chemotaxis protein [Sulfurimonas sp.]MDD3855863.1 methyl-accepting chemotaxis protein [Sulfurimonas sp.]